MARGNGQVPIYFKQTEILIYTAAVLHSCLA